MDTEHTSGSFYLKTLKYRRVIGQRKVLNLSLFPLLPRPIQLGLIVNKATWLYSQGI